MLCTEENLWSYAEFKIGQCLLKCPHCVAHFSVMTSSNSGV